MRKRVCVITGSRAEYGLLYPLLKELSEDKKYFELRIIVTGMHISPEFGLTYKEIEKDGFKINERVDISLISDTSAGISRSTGLAVAGFAKAYDKLRPDIVIGLGDRFEFFGAVTAALISRIPVAHISGGEITEGVFDNSLRHAITKMSHVHFTALEEYRKRVIQMGESPETVFTVGALALDNIKNLKLLSRKELERQLGIKFDTHNLLVTFHPVTLEDNSAREQFWDLLKALDGLKETKIIFTKANADIDGSVINKMLDEYVRKNFNKACVFASMGRFCYLSAMQYVDAMVGNSSSGIIEAPSFKIGTINIGDRQKGRVRTESVIDCLPKVQDIKRAFMICYSHRFRKRLQGMANPYGDGKTAGKIKNILKKIDLTNILKKSFYNIKFNAKR